MKRWSKYLWILAPAAMTILILDTKTALTATTDGITLCLRAVIPALFPFITITTLTTQALLGGFQTLLRPVGRLCKIPAGSESLLLTGFLGGYPIGGQCVYQAYRAGALSYSDAERMLVFCNNAGPAFLFGVVAGLFSKGWMIWLIWSIQILSALVVGIILPAADQTSNIPIKNRKIAFIEAMQNAVKSMANICGYVLVFRVMIAYLEKWFLCNLSPDLAVVITGFIELTNGCFALKNISEESVRFVICNGLLSFGGLCVTAQTISVSADLGKRFYFPGKVMQCCISILLSIFAIPLIYQPDMSAIIFIMWSAVILTCLVLYLSKSIVKKSIAFS